MNAVEPTPIGDQVARDIEWRRQAADRARVEALLLVERRLRRREAAAWLLVFVLVVVAGVALGWWVL